MPKKDTVIFIVADETRYGGEADYMKGLAAELKKRGLREDTDYFVYKAVRGASGSDPRVLPLNNDQYAAVPYVGEMDARLLTRAGKISLVGAGHSTLDVVIDLAARTGGRAKASYITHMVDDAGHLRKIVGNDVALFATTTQSALCAIDPSCGARAKLVALAAVPHTISKESCQAEYDSFMQFARQSADPEADMRRAILEGNDPFAFVLLNAGFEAGKKGHVPYTAEEAARAGAALGGALPPRTSLILAEGTPRSLMDRKLGEDTMGAFAAAYKRAQMALAGAEDPEETPYVVREFFEPGLPYNIVKAGYVLGGRDNCVAFISNSEGYSTMDGAVLFIDNGKKLLGMFPSDVQYADETGQHQDNIAKYNERGIAVLRALSGAKLDVGRHPREQASPVKVESAAWKIVRSMGLAQPTRDIPAGCRPKHNNM